MAKLHILTCFLFLCWNSLQIHAEEHYYVSPDGSSSGDGTASNPWNGLKTAINKIRTWGSNANPGPEDHAVLCVFFDYARRRPFGLGRLSAS